MNKADKDKVIAALEVGRIWAECEKQDRSAKFCNDAITIMRGLEDAEPVAWMHPTSSFSVITQEQKDSNSLQYSDEFLAGHTVPLYTSPQAAQTEGKPIEALAPVEIKPGVLYELKPGGVHVFKAQTEAALSEVVRLSEDAGLYDSDFQAGRAGSKP